MELSIPNVIRTENLRDTPLGDTMNEIRIWLDSKKIQPVDFKTVVSRGAFGFEISFKSERDAERFQQRFRPLLGRTGERDDVVERGH
jgi:hypothetical protein